MVTKGQIKALNTAKTRCWVRLPLFETASSTVPVIIEALINITPGMYNDLYVNDVVFVAFEENALEKPVIIGKLYTGQDKEGNTPGGAAVVKSLVVREQATIPASTTRYVYTYDNSKQPPAVKDPENTAYNDLQSPKAMADYILWLEKYSKKLFKQSSDNFLCLKNWTQWQLQPENVEVDDGDLDTNYHIAVPCKYQNENADCTLCDVCVDTNKTKKTRGYIVLNTTKKYPEY